MKVKSLKVASQKRFFNESPQCILKLHSLLVRGARNHIWCDNPFATYTFPPTMMRFLLGVVFFSTCAVRTVLALLVWSTHLHHIANGSTYIHHTLYLVPKLSSLKIFLLWRSQCGLRGPSNLSSATNTMLPAYKGLRAMQPTLEIPSARLGTWSSLKPKEGYGPYGKFETCCIPVRVLAPTFALLSLKHRLMTQYEQRVAYWTSRTKPCCIHLLTAAASVRYKGVIIATSTLAVFVRISQTAKTNWKVCILTWDPCYFSINAQHLSLFLFTSQGCFIRVCEYDRANHSKPC